MSKEIEYATPATDWQTRAFWEGCGREELVLQRCQDCGIVQHRPRGLCVSCLSDDIEHFVATGEGRVYTFTITHQNGLPAFREHCPYVLAYIELDEGPRLMSHVVGCAPEKVSIGMRVRAEFVLTDKQLGVPRFIPA